MTRRFGIYVAALLVVAALALLLAFWGLGLCSPAALPGDEGWTLRRRALEALALVLRGGNPACFTGNDTGVATVWIGAHVLWLLGAMLLAMVAWELIGREMRLGWLRSRGGHSVLAGSVEELVGIARLQSRLGPVLYLAGDAMGAAALMRRNPFAEIGTLGGRNEGIKLLRRFGAARSRLIAATTGNDSANRDIAEQALEDEGTSEILVRLEQGSVRAISSHRLRQVAEQKGRNLAVLSLEQLRTRRGIGAAMPGRYTISGNPRTHIALCGNGHGLEAAAFEVARQGYGLETERPLISILRVGAGDFGAGELERLVAAESSEVRVLTAAQTAPGAIDRAIAEIALGGPPLLAVHCVSLMPGDAEELARRWEAELVANRVPVPPIVAHMREDRVLGITGMIRAAVAPDLAEAREVALVMDARAKAVHQQFLDAQQAARGADFGNAPAEVSWERLAEGYRDDNRNVADQMDYKLARVFMAARKGSVSAAPKAADVETLAEVAHGRWMASKAVTGWRHGAQRDNRKLVHPDMIAYRDLDEPGKQKDRDEVATLPKLAALSGEALLAERRVAVPEPLKAAALEALAKRLKIGTGEFGVAVLPLDSSAMAETATGLADRGVDIELVLDITMDEIRRGNSPKAPAFAALLRRAWRIHTVLEGSAREALAERAKEVADEDGAIHARA